MLTFETLKKYLQAILNHYENESDVVKPEDIKKFIDLVNEFDDDILSNSLLKYIVYLECENKAITVKLLQHFIDNCYLA